MINQGTYVKLENSLDLENKYIDQIMLVSYIDSVGSLVGEWSINGSANILLDRDEITLSNQKEYETKFITNISKLNLQDLNKELNRILNNYNLSIDFNENSYNTNLEKLENYIKSVNNCNAHFEFFNKANYIKLNCIKKYMIENYKLKGKDYTYIKEV